MRCEKNWMRLYAVTDRSWVGRRGLYEQVEAALRGGVTCVQLREKELDAETFLKEARQIAGLCKRYHVPFIINDNVEIALACNADGVHIGQDDMAVRDVRRRVGDAMVIGVSAHSVAEALQAEADGADYLGVGAMFTTETKKNVTAMPKETLREICAAVHIPVVAIGGISEQNMLQLCGTGIDGVALVSAIFGAGDIRAACQRLNRLSGQLVMRTALTIADSDCSGGGGIQADIKTMTMNGVYAMSAVTALTAQNTTGVSAIMEVTPEFLRQQLDMIFTDIKPDAVKIGMVSNVGLIGVIAECLRDYQAVHIVVDPVMSATSVSRLMRSEAAAALEQQLFPMAELVTPNLLEAQVLTGMAIYDESDMRGAAEQISRKYGCAVLLKGGHSLGDANDLLYQDGTVRWFYGKRINNPNTHGTGCTLSSAIAANLAKGCDLNTAVSCAKEYLSGALAAMLNLGYGNGPMNHGFDLSSEYAK